MPDPKQSRPVLFCGLIAAVLLTLIGVDRISPVILPLNAYLYHPWEYMMGAFRYNIPRKDYAITIDGYGDLANMLGAPSYRVMRAFTWTNDRYGKRNAQGTQHDAPEIVVVGDSFMASAGDSDKNSFVTQLQNAVDVPVTGYVPSDMSLFLRDARFKENPPKIVLWGRVERNTIADNGEIQTLLKDTSCFSTMTQRERLAKISKDFVKQRIGNFVEYAQLSILRRTMEQSLRHLLFRWTGKHTKSVILISGEPMLFHDRGLAVLSSPGAERGLDAVADAVARVRDCLADRGTRLIFMAIPDKEHVYASRLGREVSTPDPLLVLEQELDERSLDYVSLVKPFLAESGPGKELLYWSDDTHWNARGMGVGVEEVIKALD